jgi:hypothetical protein
MAQPDLLQRHDAVVLEYTMLRATVNRLLEIMTPVYGPNFPNDRLVIDVETTGVRFHNFQEAVKRGWKHFDGDLITELGFCHVKENEVKSTETLVLDWTMVPSINKQALANRMAETKRHMEIDQFGQPTGKSYKMSMERMQDEGADPVEVLSLFHETLEDARTKKHFIIAHNGYAFDSRMFEDHFQFWCKKMFRFGDNEIFDTGMVIKASQSNQVPWTTDTSRSWSARTYAQRLKGIKWSLDRYAVPLFGLAEKYNLNMDEAHGAGFDCYVSDCLFREMLAIAKGERADMA